MVGIKTFILEYVSVGGSTFQSILFNIIFALAILIVGLFLGKVAGRIVKKISQKPEIHKKFRESFVDLFAVIIRWSIYIIFINLAIKQLGIPEITSITDKVLVTIPALTGALLLLTIGFVIAVYLREIIEDAEIGDWQTFSKLIYYFVIYVFGIYALKVALITLPDSTVNWVIIIVTVMLGLKYALTGEKNFLFKNNP